MHKFIVFYGLCPRLCASRTRDSRSPDRRARCGKVENWPPPGCGGSTVPVRSLPTPISPLLLALLICGRVTAFLLLLAHTRVLGTGCWCLGCRCNGNRSFCGSERRTDAITSGPLDTHLQQHIRKSIRSQRTQLSESR